MILANSPSGKLIASRTKFAVLESLVSDFAANLKNEPIVVLLAALKRKPHPKGTINFRSSC